MDTTVPATGGVSEPAPAGSLAEILGRSIARLTLEERQRELIRDRWLDQVLWMESAAKRAQQRYYRLRLTVVIGAVLVPALVGPSAVDDLSALRWIGLAVSVVVAAAGAVEGFMHYGDRWRHYRLTVELLKSEGWSYEELRGVYQPFGSHGPALPTFMDRVELILEHDVRQFISTVAAERGGQSGGSTT